MTENLGNINSSFLPPLHSTSFQSSDFDEALKLLGDPLKTEKMEEALFVPQEWEYLHSGYVNFEKNLSFFPDLKDVPEHIDKKGLKPAHLGKEVGSKKARVILPESVIKNHPDIDEKNIDLYKGGRKIAHLKGGSFTISSYSPEQLIVVTNLFNKTMENFLKEKLKHKLDKTNFFEKRKLFFVDARLILKVRSENRNINRVLNNKRKNLVSESIRLYELATEALHIIKSMEKEKTKFLENMKEIKIKTKEKEKEKVNEDVNIKINEKYNLPLNINSYKNK